MKTLSAVIKQQFEKKGDNYYIRYSENQFNSFQENINIFTPDQVNNEEENNYEYQQICVTTIDKNRVIAQLIIDRYSYDCQIALFANQGDGDPAHKKEFDEYQKFRRFAKKLTDLFIVTYA